MVFKTADNAADQLLWKKLMNGDDEAYSRIYEGHIGELFSYGMRFTADRELIKDCIQDIFVNIYKNRFNLKVVENIKLYLFIALKNRLFSVFEKDKQFYCIDSIEPVFSVDYSIEEEIIQNERLAEQRENIKCILGVLTPRQKEVIYYRYAKGMKISYICEIMNMNFQSVQNLLQRAIKKIHSTFVEKDHRIYKLRKNPYY
jgi:RNA polymerase sigma factor (sigma-70 family)